MHKGLAYPLTEGDKGLFKEETDAALLKGDILQLLGTEQGERVMLPEFGSRLRRFIHDPLDDVTGRLMVTDAVEAIKRWEKRVALRSADVQLFPEEQRVKLSLRFVIKQTGESVDFYVGVDGKRGVYQWA